MQSARAIHHEGNSWAATVRSKPPYSEFCGRGLVCVDLVWSASTYLCWPHVPEPKANGPHVTPHKVW